MTIQRLFQLKTKGTRTVQSGAWFPHSQEDGSATRPTWPLIHFAMLGLVLAAAGCLGEPPAPREVPVPIADAPADSGELKGTGDGKVAADPNVIQSGPFPKKFEGITFQVPEGWQEVKLSGGLVGFVDSRFVIPSKEGTVELTCLTSPSGIRENITRWVGQFLLAPDGKQEETIDVDGADAQWVDLRGTFNGTASGKQGPHDDWRMLGVGVPVGSKSLFLKLNGPDAAVAEVRESFRDFVKSGRLEAN